MPSPPVWDFLCFKSSFRHCSALQSTLAALLTSILQQRFSSNIYAGSSNGLALTLFSLRHRRIPSLFFSSSSWIQTVRPYHGCHRYRTSWDSILWVFDGPLVPQEPTALVAGQGLPNFRPVQSIGAVIAVPEVGGLHHRYERRA